MDQPDAKHAHCYSSFDYYSYYSDENCVGNDAEYYGGIACFAIGAVLKLVAWILLIIFCVRRRRVQRATEYASAPTMQGSNQQYAQPFVAPQPTYPVAEPSAQYAARSLASQSPVYPDAQQTTPYPNTPPPKEATETTIRFCGQCGASITSPFCPHCGTRMNGY
ncbi:hypothetical protein N7510_004985 [Penicillium lagena]|uniref:uncharacterized protein n=1 Tax=Penicillium lagena TaxID=94218 RepID=UPI0025425E67|nr:uncharacterized protein N7510_004985 [Penicillium lagena]KAJ5621001.1 hypothetical protein N7510_004985 [Penicillium lagena]